MTLEAMDSIDEIVALNIFMRMGDLKMSQKNLAMAANITPAYLNKLLNGKKPASKSHALKSIAKALFIEEAELYQDQKAKALAGARAQADASTLADLKKFNRLLQEQVSETLEDYRNAKAQLLEAQLSKEEQKLIDLFRATGAAGRRAILSAAESASASGKKNKARPPRGLAKA